jgi:glycosyltransferase involved in cell wall biosynthesis
LALGRLSLYHSPDFTLPPTLPGTPTLLTVHDLSFARDPDSTSPALRRFLDAAVPRSVRRATRVLADSEATRQDLIDLYQTLPAKVAVMYSGVDSRFRPVRDPAALDSLRRKYGLGDAPFILSVGTIHLRKNYIRLMQALARLAATDESARLVIAGGPGWGAETIYAETGRLGLEGRVIFPGFVADEDLPALYSAAAAFAYPSLYEGFGLPLLEAMACGTPSLTSTVSCLPEVAGDAALLVNPRDVDEMAASLKRLMDDNLLRRELVARGLGRAAEFTWERAAAQLLAEYARLGHLL